MAEVLRTRLTGEQTEKFLQFLLMQTQQALLALGKHPSRPAGAAPPNLTLGRVFIEHLTMLRAKTDGNLTADEQNALNNAIAHLEKALAEAMQEQGGRE